MSKKPQFRRRRKIILGFLLILVIILGNLLGLPRSLVRFSSLNDEEVLAQTSPETQLATNVTNSLNEVLLTVQENSLLPVSYVSLAEERVVKRMKVVVTAYSSSPWETDDTPYITASGAFVREGIAANNLLPFGTQFKIPEIFGEKFFVVEDRLNQRKGDYHVDIWFSSREEALNFGTRQTYIEIIQET